MYSPFKSFLDIQTSDSYEILKDQFIEFTFQNTNIQKDKEVRRIFSKILNILSFC